jgi:hypothetical protein
VKGPIPGVGRVANALSKSALRHVMSLLSGALRLKGGSRGWVRASARSERISSGWKSEEIARELDLLYRCERTWKTDRAPDDTRLVRAVQGLTERR